MNEAKPRPVVGVGSPAIIRLNAFGDWCFKAFGTIPYLVGSAAQGKVWRDVDVRLILDDEGFDKLFGGFGNYHDWDPKWALICAAISALAQQQTGLPVDFQIQRQSHADLQYSGLVRVPLCFMTRVEATA